MKMTRRALALSALTGAAAAQAPPGGDELEESKKQVETHSQTLLRYELPMSAEPAFQFKA